MTKTLQRLSSSGFHLTAEPEPHRARARRILSAHPEVKGLFGRERWTAPLLCVLVLAQVASAWGVAQGPWWVTPLAAWCVGAFVAHALYAGIHETAHNLAFRRKPLNKLLGLVANLPLALPMSVAYGHYHLQHHLHMGDPARDPDLPDGWEPRVFGRSWLGKLVWQTSLPLLQLTRGLRVGPPPARLRGWLALNVCVQVAFDALLVWAFGPAALAYLVLSFWFTLALHPCAGRYVQEHHLVFGEQETSSYYGPLNRLALNVGHHNEHHDFPFVAWSRLPRLRALAPEAYGELESHSSWTRLWLRFLADPRLGIDSRVLRSG